MKVIGLTGGIGTGKSTVSNFLRGKGYEILDADGIAREITEKGSPVLMQIADTFGEDMLDSDGCLDRKKLAAVVFCDPAKKAKLEEITTSKVIEIISAQIEDLRRRGKHDIIFVDAPLLYETNAHLLTDLVWLVDADDAVRIERVMERDGATESDVLARMKNQMSSEEKRTRAEEIIDNSRGKEELYHQVEHLLEKYAEYK